jgi:ubiquinone/menaquinone biosynthesis C-methylase UbiE
MSDEGRMSEPQSELEASYDRIAAHYAEEFFAEFKRKPFDCEVLEAFAESMRALGQVCEVGCGPGQISRFLQDRGVQICGLDLSEEMIKFARELNPDITFTRGDMMALELPNNSFAGSSASMRSSISNAKTCRAHLWRCSACSSRAASSCSLFTAVQARCTAMCGTTCPSQLM